jgi:hypothetical protein
MPAASLIVAAIVAVAAGLADAGVIGWYLALLALIGIVVAAARLFDRGR